MAFCLFSHSYSNEIFRQYTMSNESLIVDTFQGQLQSKVSLVRVTAQSCSYTAKSRKVVGKNVHTTISKGSMGYEQYIVPDTVAIEPTLLLSFSNRKHMSMASRAILSNFFERTVNSKPPTIPFGIVACTFFRQPFSK